MERAAFAFFVSPLLGMSASSYGGDGGDWQKSVEAIAAMQGCYEVSFEFRETEALRDGYEVREEPYRARALEYIHFSRDGEKLSLQNVMKLPGGMYLKHWRQVWEYQPAWQYTFRGLNIWEKEYPESRPGTWLQRVYQVDDSPRYECAASWTHGPEGSSWTCETWSPLPRREYSQRNDYHILKRGNIHQITSEGWDHIQENQKLVLDPVSRESVLSGEAVATGLVAEAGLNRYVKVDDSQCAGVKAWWEKQEEVWSPVQEVWKEIYEDRDFLILHEDVQGRKLWQALFGLTARYSALLPLSPEEILNLKEDSRRLISQWLTDS